MPAGQLWHPMNGDLGMVLRMSSNQRGPEICPSMNGGLGIVLRMSSNQRGPQMSEHSKLQHILFYTGFTEMPNISIHVCIYIYICVCVALYIYIYT